MTTPLAKQVEALEMDVACYKEFHDAYNEYRLKRNPDANKYTEVDKNIFAFEHSDESDAMHSKLANEIVFGHPVTIEEVDGVWYSYVDLNPAIIKAQKEAASERAESTGPTGSETPSS